MGGGIAQPEATLQFQGASHAENGGARPGKSSVTLEDRSNQCERFFSGHGWRLGAWETVEGDAGALGPRSLTVS